ncbi:DUF2163 domain-containing protein [Croceibacterium sp. LX-88]|uniref:DUF2163 domain-containing protein n=1 Tax=Croceibacterium selenioxidans TaxID=2838833 RepID=A0ABS5W726_9SPHN|nr:DUF2163 domain-containing protein [Croceibacterium selenioxidans]MBT2135118.1 DUF2163 domain-containing protein [Croceibacterium selenioxidans]
MGRAIFRRPLEGVATYWRVHRRDGVALGFTSHDRDLWFDGLLHRAAPGMLPSAIRRSADLFPDSAEVQGALTHGSIRAVDLTEGRFDGAVVEIGVVDWESLARIVLYRGEIGTVSSEAGTFNAELNSAKALLDADVVPRTSPACRARFCGPGCTLAAVRFIHEVTLSVLDSEASKVRFAGAPPAAALHYGSLRWLDGPHAGLAMEVVSADADGLVLDQPLDPDLPPGTRALLREGCDHTLRTCHERFGNSVNFRGEPFLPGNDVIARYPVAKA